MTITDLDALEINLRAHLMTSKEANSALAVIAELRASRELVEALREIAREELRPYGMVTCQAIARVTLTKYENLRGFYSRPGEVPTE